MTYSNPKHQRRFEQQAGYILTSVLVFVMFTLLVSYAMIMVAVSNLRSLTYVDEGLIALTAAESGAENAVLRLLRDPAYTGETIDIGGATVEIDIVATSPAIIVATADTGAFEKSVEVRLERIQGVLQLTSWKEL